MKEEERVPEEVGERGRDDVRRLDERRGHGKEKRILILVHFS